MPLIASNVDNVNIYSLNLDGVQFEGDASPSNPVTIKDNGINGSKLVNSSVTLNKIATIGTNKLVGSNNTGQVVEIILSGLSLINGVLSASGTSANVSKVQNGNIVIIVKHTGTAPILTGSSGIFTLVVPSGTDIKSWNLFVNDSNGILNGQTFNLYLQFSTSIVNNFEKPASVLQVQNMTTFEKFMVGNGLGNIGIQLYEDVQSGKLLYTGVGFGANGVGGFMISCIYG